MVPNQVSNNLRKTSNFTNTLEMELWRPLFAQYLVNILTVICLHPWLHQLLLTGPDCFHRHHSPAPILPHRIRPLFFFFFDKLTFLSFQHQDRTPKWSYFCGIHWRWMLRRPLRLVGDLSGQKRFQIFIFGAVSPFRGFRGLDHSWHESWQLRSLISFSSPWQASWVRCQKGRFTVKVDLVLTLVVVQKPTLTCPRNNLFPLWTVKSGEFCTSKKDKIPR